MAIVRENTSLKEGDSNNWSSLLQCVSGSLGELVKAYVEGMCLA